MECTTTTGLFCRKGLIYTLMGKTNDGHANAKCGKAALHPVHCPDQTGKVKNTHSCICTSQLGTTGACTANQYCKSSKELPILGKPNAVCSAKTISAASAQQLPIAAAVLAAVMVMYQAL